MKPHDRDLVACLLIYGIAAGIVALGAVLVW
jgi:hypothetical protein